MNFNTQLIEYVIYPSGAAQTTFTLNDVPYLRDAQVFSIETYTADDMATSPQGNAVITTAVLQKTYMNIYKNDASKLRGPGMYVRNLPLSTMHLLQNSATTPFERWPFDLSGEIIYWDKVELVLGSAIGNTGANVSFLFNINFKFTTAQ